MTKIKNLLLLLVLAIFAFSCNRNDDICESGEATPRVKFKFKTQSTGKLKTLDSIFVKVDYGDGEVSVISNTSETDSILLPIRVDDAGFTDVYVGTSQTQFSVIRLSYTTENEYVSPACGIKRLYKNASAEVTTTDPVVAVQQNQNDITDEEKTHFYLLF